MPVFIARPGYLQWWAFPLYALLLGGTGFIVMRGIFRRKHMERQLQLETEHKTRLEEINRSKSTFFANITHEFKTPLTLIQGPAEEIARRTTDPQVVKQANQIARNAKSILGLVNQLLDLGKLEANLDEPKFYRLDLVERVRHWMEKFHPLARQKEIRLGFECDQPSLYVDFDPVKLETVVNNLLSNAVKFTPEHGRVKCTVRMADETDMAEIVVEDNGPGIPEDDQAFVFDRFFQGAHAVTGGTGIGLSFVREMVRVHGGRVSLSSAPGRGACFTVALPTVQAGTLDLPAIALTMPTEEERLSTGHIPTSPGSDERPVVLIVEDNADVAMLVMDVLGGEHTMLHALNGRDGHAEAVRQVPDLIITDVMMPVMDGYTMTHLLRQDMHTAHIPIVMLTARDGPDARIEGRAHGADVYLEKPFAVRELQLTVRNLLLLKKRMAEKAAGQADADVAGIEFETAADNTFYRQFLAVIEDNLSEPGLSVEDFTRRLGISRTQLHRKLKAITGLSVNQVVRNMRLQRALVLLRDSGMTVSEVGYAVGFSSPSYFAERFREHYGYSPSEAARPGASRE
jgi:signal transduction histidine kinase/DNA-binding response OmpR family regulator